MGAELTRRQESILDAVIREYVATAEPVASADIVAKHRLAASPATVRNELAALDEAGYLAQPHTSAGRVPTDKGYRFYINHLAARAEPDERHSRRRVESREEQALRELTLLDEPAEFAKQVSRILAHLTGNFVLTGFPEEALFYKWGASEVMQEPEFADLGLMHEFSALMDTLEDDLMKWFVAGELGEPRTFIGGENPIRRARRYGMIVSACNTPFAQESMIALIGPKRMDYEHNLALLRHFRELMNA